MERNFFEFPANVRPDCKYQLRIPRCSFLKGPILYERDSRSSLDHTSIALEAAKADNEARGPGEPCIISALGWAFLIFHPDNWNWLQLPAPWGQGLLVFTSFMLSTVMTHLPTGSSHSYLLSIYSLLVAEDIKVNTSCMALRLWGTWSNEGHTVVK